MLVSTFREIQISPILDSLARLYTLLNVFHSEMSEGWVEWLSQAKCEIEAGFLRFECYVLLRRPDQGCFSDSWGKSIHKVVPTEGCVCNHNDDDDPRYGSAHRCLKLVLPLPGHSYLLPEQIHKLELVLHLPLASVPLCKLIFHDLRIIL